MVRQKSRWLVVRFDFEENVKARTNAPGNTIDKKLIYFALQEVIYETFGIVQAGIIEDLQVRLYNPDTRLAIIKTSRDSADIVRSAITLLNQLNDEPIVASVVSIHGSARTLKLSCIELLRNTFPPSEKMHKLEEQIEQIRVIE